MTWIELRRREVEEDELPRVCMRCGAPATLVKDKTFWCAPPETRWIGGWICYITATRLTVGVPLCDRHKNYFLRLSLLFAAPFLSLAVFGSALLILRGAKDLVQQPADPLRQQGMAPEQDEKVTPAEFLLGVGSGLSVLGVLVATLSLNRVGIHAVDISDRGIRLHGVAVEFAEQVEDRRDAARERRLRRRRPPRTPKDKRF